MDAFLAASLILLGVFLISVLYVRDQALPDNYFAKDTLGILSRLRVGEVNNSYVSALVANGTITDLNATLLEQVGAFWAENRSYYAMLLLQNMTGELIPFGYGFAVYADDELIYENSVPLNSGLTVSKLIVSGIAKDKPVKGFSARAVLSSIQARTTNSYSYFGGFIGEGNITQLLLLPNKTTSIKEAYLEVDASGDFSLYINSAYSGSYAKGSAGGGLLLADKFVIDTGYLKNFVNGTNLIRIVFNSSGFISGGFLRVRYTTGQLNDSDFVYFQSQSMATRREWLPGVEGVINMYSSFYVPGNVTGMSARLHYNSDFFTTFTLGNITVYSAQGSGNQVADLSDTELSAMLDYSSLGSRTIPLRVSSGSGNQTIVGQGIGDVVLVNDASGSMEWCSGTVCTTSLLGPRRYCGTNANYRPENGTYCDWMTENYTVVNNGPVCSARWHAHCTANDSRKIDIALNASRVFASTVLSTVGNQLGLVEYTNPWNSVIPQGGEWTDRYAPFPDSIVGRLNLTSNYSAADSHLAKYMDAYWGTCICCGVVDAVDMLSKLSNSSRKRSMVVMSDGEATDKCTGVGTGNAKADAVKAAQDACTNYNITVYTVGFGSDVDEETLQSMAACNGSYFNATNVQDLIDAYRAIADQLVAISYSSQVINVSGGGNAYGVLYNDSYMEINYTFASSPQFNRIPITFETDRFGNNISQGTLVIPPNLTVSSVKVTSYSGDRWTDNVTISNSGTFDVFSLAGWGNDYVALGDPFVVDVPVSYVTGGNNVLRVGAGVAPFNYSSGSMDDKAIYTLNIDTTTAYTASLTYAVGCAWTVFFEDNSSSVIRIPSYYNGSSMCYYSNASYNGNDAVDVTVYSLLDKLDLDQDGLLDVVLSQDDLLLDTVTIKGVPSLWGPAVLEARLWQ
ncbi:VWA domain-containing protein [Candidatus Woesearchaeota archaeon]|nr:VWA domain-containing protein [Candidatus Woesearchaeota archaeon]